MLNGGCFVLRSILMSWNSGRWEVVGGGESLGKPCFHMVAVVELISSTIEFAIYGHHL